MTDTYIKRLKELGKQLEKARDNHANMYISDSQLYSVLDHLIGYIEALESTPMEDKG